MQKIIIRDRHDHLATGLNAEQLDALLSGADADLIDLMLEPTTLDDINLTYLPESFVDNSDTIILSAITTRRLRLDATMKALIRVLNSQLSSSDLVAGALPDIELDAGGAKVVGGAIVAKPRKSGLIATMTAEIPVSDGQSVFIIFHAPDDDPGVIGPDDTLIAFRFLLNKRDITDIVAPHNGRDISLKQTTLALANAIEKNSRKFQAGLKVRQQLAQELETAQAKLDDSVTRTSEYVETLQQLRESDEKTIQQVESVNEQLQNQLEINSKLERELEQARANAELKDNVVQFPGKDAPAVKPADVIDAVKPEEEPKDIKIVGYQAKYAGGTFTGEKFAETADLSVIDVADKVRESINNGTYPKGLYVSVTGSVSGVHVVIQRLPFGLKVHSDEYLKQVSLDGSLSDIDRFTPEYKDLLARITDEAQQYNQRENYNRGRFDFSLFPKDKLLDGILRDEVAGYLSRYELKYNGNYKGDKYEATKRLPLTELTKKIRLAITGAKKTGALPSELRVSVTQNGRAINMEVQALPDAFNVYSQDYIAEYVRTGEYPSGVDGLKRHSDEFTALTNRLSDEANQYNMNNSDSVDDSYNKHFFTSVNASTAVEKSSFERQVEQHKAATAGGAETGLPAPSKQRDGSELKPIEIEATDKDLAALGQAEITSVGGENIYMLKDGLHYYSKVQNTEQYRVGAWDFTKTPEENSPVQSSDNNTGEPVPENVLNDAPELAGQSEKAEEVQAQVDDGQSADDANAEVQTAAAEPVEIAAAAEPETSAEEAAPDDLGINPEILAAQKELDDMRAQQERMKKANALVRSYLKAAEKDADKARADLLVKMQEIKFSPAVVDKMLTPNYMGRVVAFEAYTLTNLNARIKGREDRIKELEAREAKTAQGDMELDFTINDAPVTVEVDLDADRLRVSFPRLTGRAKESDPEYSMVQKISRGANWSPSNRAWQRKITSNAMADIAYSLGFKNWDDLVAKGKLEQQAAAEPVQDEQQDQPVLAAVEALSSAVDAETDADKLMDMIDAALAEIASAQVDESEHAELLEKASNRVTELLEAA